MPAPPWRPVRDRIASRRETQKQVLESQAKVAEEIAKEREQRLVGLQDRLLDLQNSFLAEDEVERVHFEQSIALLYEAWNTRIQVDEFGNTERLLSDAEFKKQREQLELQHQAKLGNIEAQGQLQRQVFERQTLRQKTQTVLGELLLITRVSRSTIVSCSRSTRLPRSPTPSSARTKAAGRWHIRIPLGPALARWPCRARACRPSSPQVRRPSARRRRRRGDPVEPITRDPSIRSQVGSPRRRHRCAHDQPHAHRPAIQLPADRRRDHPADQ